MNDRLESVLRKGGNMGYMITGGLIALAGVMLGAAISNMTQTKEG
jgi:hypothetical protein